MQKSEGVRKQHLGASTVDFHSFVMDGHVYAILEEKCAEIRRGS